MAATLRKIGLGGITGSPQAFAVCCVILVALLGLPLLHNGYYENLVRGILMFATMAMGWNLIGGYAGYVSFGNVVFFGLGTYASAFLALHGVNNVWLAIPLAMVVAALFAAVVGTPILRLRGHYFGIATLGIALAMQEIVANTDALGGGSGVTLRQAAWFGQYYYAMWLVCAVSLVAVWTIARSKFGYALVAIRENEDAAVVLGINPTFYKVTAWAISGAMAAAAGAVFAFSNGFIDPSVGFAIDYNVFPIVMAILGGMGTVAGPFLGAFLLTAINETLWSHFPQIHTLFFGLVIVLVVLFLPRGLLYLGKLRGGWRGLLDSFSAYRV
ncbi:MAG TPA: branched-chain amino acid ABC transporter permease [Candidatus Baltobacteraceae bacterium]|nr:branched-chain amino acid ABC transporter permease [Candidatus Baltobacteraceae bacterium]